MSSVLNCSQLSRTFSEGKEALHILRDINLDIAAGERVAIMGASGSGKSTLLHLLGGLDDPTTGEVFISGVPASSGLFTSFIIYCPSLRR